MMCSTIFCTGQQSKARKEPGAIDSKFRRYTSAFTFGECALAMCSRTLTPHDKGK